MPALAAIEFYNMSIAHIINQRRNSAMNSGASAMTNLDGQDAVQRLGRKYRFEDPNMDLFFVAALGWGKSGGLDVGEAFEIASHITDGDADSWICAFENQAKLLDTQADVWAARGWIRAAGEMRLKAFAAYRSAWQFAAPGETFIRLYALHRAAFTAAMRELALPATFLEAPYAGKTLPGIFLANPRVDAPAVLVIGGADTCFEDLFLSIGRNLLERGYSVAMVDLPGQGATANEGMYWESEAEHPIGAVIDVLINRFAAQPGRIALIGLSLGGYFVARAAGYESRLATVIASAPFPNPNELFALSVRAAAADSHRPISTAAKRSYQVALWKAGATGPAQFVTKTTGMIADPTRVTVPFLSILGGGDSAVFAEQAMRWYREIRSARKSFVLLDAATGADGHCQANNRLRLAQEACGWMDEIFGQK
jgi:pimeloyl-ACP methyl ester carboxylesterase